MPGNMSKLILNCNENKSVFSIKKNCDLTIEIWFGGTRCCEETEFAESTNGMDSINCKSRT